MSLEIITRQAEATGGAKQNEYGPHIDAEVLKRDYGRVELGAETYVDVADVLFGCTRHTPET